jgi:putative spermidine/putrescine transport system substrate-binding protein
MRRTILLILAVLILVAGAFWWWSRPLPVLNVVTWPGAYGRAQAAAQMQAYGTAKRVDVRIQQWAENGTLEELRRAIATHRAGDVVDLELPVAVAACKAGLLEPIDAATLPAGADGTAADKDFYKGMIGRCFVASAIYAQMIVCVRPCTGNLADLFNSVRQVLEPPVTGKSGLDNLLARAGATRKIGLQRAAKVNLEIALLADGVMPNMVYGLLETDAGVQRAFAKLDTIKSNIVWWRNSSEPAELLRKGQVAATTILTEDAQTALQNTDRALVSPQFMEADVLALPKSDVKSDRALDYLRFATGTAPLANMVKFAPYMPPRRSAMPLVEKLPASPTRDFVASQKNPMHAPFAINDDWWAEHGPALEARFRAWLGPA